MILDSLVYILSADTKGVDKGLQESEQSVQKFSKSMADAEKTGQSMANSIIGSLKRIGGAAVAAIAIGKTLGRLDDFVNTTGAVANLSEATGDAVEDIDAFRKALEKAGGSTSDAMGNLRRISARIGSALGDPLGQRAEDFDALGVSIRNADGSARGTVEVMGDLADVISKMDPQLANKTMRDLGIRDPGTIALMRQGREEFEKLLEGQRRAGVITSDTVDKVTRYSDAWTDFRRAVGAAFDEVSEALLPTLTLVFEKLGDAVSWMREHKEFMLGFLSVISVALLTAYAPAMVAAATATWAFLAPILAVAVPIILVAALIGLLVDEIYNFIQGNDSLIGQLLEKFPIIGETFKAMVQWVKDAYETIKETLTRIRDAFGNAFDWIGEKVDQVAEWFRGSIDQIKSTLRSWRDSVRDTVQRIIDAVLGFPTAVRDMVRQANDWFENLRESSEGFTGAIVAIFGFLKDGVVLQFELMWAAVKWIWDKVAALIEKAKAGAKAVGGLFGRGRGGSATGSAGSGPPTDPASSLAIAYEQTTAAAANPANTMTPAQLRGQTNNNVTLGELQIVTQATDADGIARDIGSSLKQQLKQLQDENNSGVTR